MTINRRRLPWFFITIVLSFFLYLYETLPLLSGYAAKVCCSAVFVSHRSPDSVVAHDLRHFPFFLARCTVDATDSSVTATVLGLARKRALYHHGLGSVLVNGISEENLRHQWATIQTAPPPPGPADTLAQTPLLNALLQHELAREGARALLVIRHDTLIGEAYAPGFNDSTPLAGWSMTKSVTNALLGVLSREGRLDTADRAPVGSWHNDARKDITIKDLMCMRSGLRWWEFYIGPCPCTDMLFKAKDMGLAAAQCDLRHTPGEVFNYSSGTANILSKIIRDKIPVEDYYRWPYERLLYKIGMRHATLEPDAGGTFVGSSYCYATARDWGRLGLLYLHDGVWRGERLLPEGWVRFSTTGPGVYGALWWLNGGRWPHLPADAYAAEGYEGQYVCVIPSKDLVVVHLALFPARPDIDGLVNRLLHASFQ